MPNILQPSLSNTPTKKTTTSGAFTPYVDDLLKRSQAFSTAETPAYTGQLTTGPSTLQQEAFKGLSSLTVPTDLTNAAAGSGSVARQQQDLNYDPNSYGNLYEAAAQNYKPVDITADTFGVDQARQYMDPFLEMSLKPQLEQLRRQAAIDQLQGISQLTKAGAYGGGRQAVLQGLNQEALMRQQAATTGKGYSDAFSSAMTQFNADQNRKMDAQKANANQALEAAKMGMTDAELKAKYGLSAQEASEKSKQFAANYKASGLKDATSSYGQQGLLGDKIGDFEQKRLEDMVVAGSTQRSIDQAALDAQYKEWLRQSEYPQKQLEFQRSQLSGLAGLAPKETEEYGQKKSALDEASGAIAGFGKMAEQLGIKSFDDLKKLAATMGTTAKDLMARFGISNTDAKSLERVMNESGQSVPGLKDPAPNDQEINDMFKPNPVSVSDPYPFYNTDPYDPSTGYDSDRYAPLVGLPSPYEGIDFNADYAHGGLIDILHKMRAGK